ncbi:MAG: alpha/beta hydrolase fold domain-containing protein [Prevotella sp.]|nr:alpha/beta hydrolase fold domain-containing protein [Prevotella sp.]
MRHFLLSGLLAVASVVFAQTNRTFTFNITPDGKANMVAYLPGNPTGRAIVDCPGGGYSHLSMQNEGHDWASFFNKRGIAYFVLTYRMPNGDRNIPMSDARMAIRTVRDSADAWKINPRDVGIMGFSAGGHLASTMSTHNEWAERPDFSILFYPVVSMNERETHRGSVMGFLGDNRNDKDLVKSFSNFNAVRRHLTPPAIIILANDDRAVPPVTNGIAYYSAMRRAGNDCTLHVYTSGGHGFGFRSNFKYHNQMLADLDQWLRDLKAPKTDAIRVACIGNSITDGMGIDMSERLGYPAQLQRILGSGYDVKNFGVSARTMLNKGDYPYMNEQAWKDALGFLAPGKKDGSSDIVIIKLGTNDSKDYNWKYGSEFEADMQQMVDSLCPMVPVLNKKGKPTKKMKRADSPRIFLCTPIKPVSDRWGISGNCITNEVIPAIRRVAEKNGLTIIDLNSLFSIDDGNMQGDGIHPTDKGARRMAEIIADAIKK